MVPDFFPFEFSRVCSTSCGKAFILRLFCFGKDLKSKLEGKTETCLGVCRIPDFWGVERDKEKERGSLIAKIVYAGDSC